MREKKKIGRQICVMEATQFIITSPPNYTSATPDPFADRRQPFEDPALRSLDNLSESQPSDLFTLEHLTKLAVDSGLSDVVRWKPKMVSLSGRAGRRALQKITCCRPLYCIVLNAY